MNDVINKLRKWKSDSRAKNGINHNFRRRILLAVCFKFRYIIKHMCTHLMTNAFSVILRDWYDFAAKYTPGMTEYHLPARLAPARYRGVLNLAERAAQALDVSGAVRLFFFHSECTRGGEPRLSVRHGQAGFFTDERLVIAGLGGMVWMAIGGFIMAKMVSFEI